MVKRTVKNNPNQGFDDEIDLFELLHFVVDLRVYWIPGFFIFAALALIYTYLFMPVSGSLLLKNDIGLTQQTLALTQVKLPGLVKPLLIQDPDNRALSALSNPAWISKNLTGLSGLDLSKIKNLDPLDEKKQVIDSIRISHKARTSSILQQEVVQMADAIRASSQYIGLQNFLQTQLVSLQRRRVQLQNTLEDNQLMIERLTAQIMNYQAIAKRYPQSVNQQLVIDLTNEVGDDSTSTQSMNRVDELRQSKYLPITSRLTALETQLSDLKTAKQQLLNELEAIQIAFQQLTLINNELPSFSLQGVNLSDLSRQHLDSLLADPNLQRETRVMLSGMHKELSLIELQINLLKMRIPLYFEEVSRRKYIVVGGLFGGVLGFLYGCSLRLIAAYRRRYG
jgi:hypothetical protein